MHEAFFGDSIYGILQTSSFFNAAKNNTYFNSFLLYKYTCYETCYEFCGMVQEPDHRFAFAQNDCPHTKRYHNPESCKAFVKYTFSSRLYSKYLYVAKI